MDHDHDDRLRLTIGCDACIERVKIDQAVALLDDWLKSLDPGMTYEDEFPLPRLEPTPHRRYHAYRALRGLGFEADDVRYALAAWQVEQTPIGELLK